MTVISGCSSLSGSLGPRAHTKYLSQALRGIVHARWVRKVSGEGHFWSEILMSEGAFSGGLFASNVTQMAVISGWYGLWIHETKGTCQMSRFGDGGHAKCSMGPK